MSEVDRLRDSDTGISLDGASEAVLRGYLEQVLRENAQLRAWQRLALDALPQIPGLKSDPARARAWLLGTRAAMHDRHHRAVRELDALHDLLADVVVREMPEDWQRRHRAFRGGAALVESSCPACLSPSRLHHGFVRERGVERGPSALCEHLWHASEAAEG